MEGFIKGSRWLSRIITIEVMHSLLDFVTLLGDTGVSPMTTAVCASVMTYIVKGPMIALSAVTLVVVVSLKVIEVKNDSNPMSPSPRRVVARRLQRHDGYSPLLLAVITGRRHIVMLLSMMDFVDWDKEELIRNAR